MNRNCTTPKPSAMTFLPREDFPQPGPAPAIPNRYGGPGSPGIASTVAGIVWRTVGFGRLGRLGITAVVIFFLLRQAPGLLGWSISAALGGATSGEAENGVTAASVLTWVVSVAKAFLNGGG